MRKLSLIIVLLIIFSNQSIADPHGKSLKISCDDCHNSSGWTLDRKTMSFSHSTTSFQLDGMHQQASCRSCHPTLIFSEARNECMSCHTDVHQQSLGNDCANCHTSTSWIVENITTIHQQSRFPLLGAHATADCFDCHLNASLLRFDPIGINCIDCHQEDYFFTTKPNHIESGFSTDCMDCHKIDSYNWEGSSFTHAFFPLTLGHEISDCQDCHTSGTDYSTLSSDCFTCHQNDYQLATNPNHLQANLSTTCTDCHSTNPGWKPADFTLHDNIFPIYSGEHRGEWDNCTDCHTNTSNYIIFSCIDCHEHNQSDMNEEHQGIGGYSYNSTACFECHPTGSGEGGFNHNASNFPLMGAHSNTSCLSCHSTGYSGTSTYCYDCHTTDFNQSTNPNHVQIGLAHDCDDCHTSDPDWTPATFAIHNEFHVLAGAHAGISNDCNACHEGNYNSTPNTCFGCHQDDYNQTTKLPHLTAQISTDCLDCHTESEWEPSTFNHDSYYLLSGAHINIAQNCLDCHNENYTNTPTTCIGCHEEDYNQTSEPSHLTEQFSTECLECHTDIAWIPSTLDHNNFYPLTGAHTTTLCSDCHSSGYNSTPSLCSDCHTNNYNETTNPNHTTAGFINDCEICHTTNPGWAPALYTNHNAFYVITGAHTAIASDCNACHNGNYSTTPNTCIGCHQNDYNQTTNPSHLSSQFSTNCLDCHSQSAWVPSSFNHNNYYPLTGAHLNTDCLSCHTNGYVATPNLCIDCHQANYDQTANPNHSTVGFTTNCDDCHTTVPGWIPATFTNHNAFYVITGAHTAIASDCNACHNGNYSTTPNMCIGCHQNDYNQTTNPSHLSSQFSANCLDCHSQSAWVPSSFNHNNYYPLTGAHLNTDCLSCHTNGYVATPNLCIDCHQANYDQTANPNHSTVGFTTNCDDCHTTVPGWIPATFTNHNAFYVITGAHTAIASDCNACHNGNYSTTPNTCIGCHQNDFNQTSDPPHLSANFSTDCLLCHTQSAWEPSSFDHDGQYFPIYSGKHNGEWNSCTDCHTTPSNYALFSCIDCHEHNKTDMDDEHRGESGYAYNSISCLDCHPKGVADD